MSCAIHVIKINGNCDGTTQLAQLGELDDQIDQKWSLRTKLKLSSINSGIIVVKNPTNRRKYVR